MMRRIVSVRPVDVLIIDLTDVPSVDGSAALTLEEIMQRAMDVNQEILVVGMQFGVARVLSRIGALDGLRETMRFSSRIEAIETARRILAERAESMPG
jgi:anti-anti-sigma regulatory factor